MGRVLILVVGAVLIFVLAFLLIRRTSNSGDNLEEADEDKVEDQIMNSDMGIKSGAFGNEGTILAKYTCDGENINPPLTFTGIPADAKSLALIVEDPDVPKSIRPDGMWNHWLVWNMPADTTDIEEGSIPPGVIGKNTGGDNVYQGPCPPDREHRYFFKLFALDTELELDEASATKADLEEAMESHILGRAELMGRYERNQ